MEQDNLLNKKVIIKSDPMRPLLACQGLRGTIAQIIGKRYKIHFPKAQTYTQEEINDLWFNREDFVLA